VTASVPLPRITPPSVSVFVPVPPFATESWPATVTTPAVPVLGVRPVVPKVIELTPVESVPDVADVMRPCASTVNAV
jgi:hypothetical protein